MSQQNENRPLSAAEVEAIASELGSLIGAQLQDCFQSERDFGLGFYHQGETVWLWFDLNPHRPSVIRFRGQPPKRRKVVRPLTLFIRSRFLGRRLAEVRARNGRVLSFLFHRAKDEAKDERGLPPCEFEARLFPHGQNLIARDGERSVAEMKPKDLPQKTLASEGSHRTWAEIEKEWLETSGGPDGRGQDQPKLPSKDTLVVRAEKEWARAIEKKQLALERMRTDFQAKLSPVAAEVGEWLKASGRLDVPEEWREWIRPDKSLSWNIEENFRKAKDNARKIAGARERINKVEQELKDLQASGIKGMQQARDVLGRRKGRSLLASAEARGRRHWLADDLEVYIGKSANDNLALLRRAQPFDLWLHLRDQPGSHAILRRSRGRVVTDVELTEAGRWVIEQSLGKRARELAGERFDLLLVECRYVRPIKGDRLGRVHYTHDRVIQIRF